MADYWNSPPFGHDLDAVVPTHLLKQADWITGKTITEKNAINWI
jgi:hypothetical protein